MKAVGKKISPRFALRVWLSLVVVSSLVVSSCFKGGDGGEQFYGKVVVPGAKEFRWSDGGLPKVFDPARAAAPPDTDAARAARRNRSRRLRLRRRARSAASRSTRTRFASRFSVPIKIFPRSLLTQRSAPYTS